MSDAKAAELKEAELKAEKIKYEQIEVEKKSIKWELSQRELDIIQRLNNKKAQVVENNLQNVMFI